MPPLITNINFDTYRSTCISYKTFPLYYMPCVKQYGRLFDIVAMVLQGIEEKNSSCSGTEK